MDAICIQSRLPRCNMSLLGIKRLFENYVRILSSSIDGCLSFYLSYVYLELIELR